MTLLDTLNDYGKQNIGFPSEAVLEKLRTLSPNIDENLKLLLETPARSVNPPLYHEEVGERLYLPIPELYIPYLQAMIMTRYAKVHSISKVATLLESHGYVVSSQGQLTNIWKRLEIKLGLKEKPVKMKMPRTQVQRQNSRDKMKVINERKKLEAAEREAKLAKKRLATAAAKTGMNTEQLKATKSPIKKAVEQAKQENKKVLYQPTEKQAEFHAADEDIVLYGGAAGGGKSYAMLMDALRYCQEEDYRALIIRRTSPMLKELISVSRSLYPKAFPGAKYNKSENVWYFPSGATIQFGYLDKEEDLENYQGLPYAYIGFDEIQHQRSDSNFIYLMSRLRSANPAIKCYIRASANPGGAPWVKELFIDSAEPNTTFFKNGISYRFIPAKLEDNPYLDTPDEGQEMSPYRKMLMALPEVQRKQLLEGDWFVGEDAMFAFSPPVHVVSEMPPLHWSIINSLDYGYKDPAASLWGAVCPTTGSIVVYQELECLEFTHGAWADAVKAAEGYVPQGVDRVIDASVFKMSGHTGPGVREILATKGLSPRPADRNREAGWNQVYQRLMVDPDTQTPTLYIHESCTKLIEQLMTARKHDKKPDDIDDKRVKSKGRYHHWDLLDALRYMLMARPQRNTIQERSWGHKQDGFEKYYGYFS